MHLSAIVALAASLFLCGASNAQSPSQTPSPGLENSWDVRQTLATLERDNLQWKPVLEKLQPQQWANEKGASTTYILQLQTAKQQLNDVSVVTNQLKLRTDSLSLLLDDYFRMEAFDVSTRSLAEGAARYETDHALPDQMNRLLASGFANRERLRDYIRELALSTEQNFKIADAEAQRCRGMISRDSPASSRKSRR